MYVLRSAYLQKREPEGHKVRLGRTILSLGLWGPWENLNQYLMLLRLWMASRRTVLPELFNPMMMMVAFLDMEKKKMSHLCREECGQTHWRK